MVAPLFGVELAQESDAVLVPIEETVREPGAVGGVATEIVVVAVLVPLLFVAVSVYVIVEAGFTAKRPMSVLVLKFPGVIATDDAFVTLKESVLDPAEATMLDEAVKEEMEGGPWVGPDRLPQLLPFHCLAYTCCKLPYVNSPHVAMGSPLDAASVMPSTEPFTGSAFNALPSCDHEDPFHFST
jgi:hypothetical protein